MLMFFSDVQAVGGVGSGSLNLLPEETSTIVKEPVGIVYSENSSNSNNLLRGERVVSRVLSATNEEGRVKGENSIEHVTYEEDAIDADDNDERLTKSSNASDKAFEVLLTMQGKQHIESSSKVNNIKHHDETPPDVRVRKLKDQLIQAKVYLSLQAVRNIPHLTREIRLRVKEVSRTIGEASKDSDLPRNANERMTAIEQSLMKARQIQDDCATSVKKLRAMLHSSEDQLRVHKKQTLFLTQLTAKTLPKGLHCLPLRLTTEYYNLNSSQQQFPNQEKLEDPGLYHYAIFSYNILATAVVVNSTAAHAKDSSKHVFHIVTDRLNYAAMRMWFLANPPGKAAVQVQNIEDFAWLNSSYSPVLKQLSSPSMIDYYFKAHRASSDSNLKFRNPKYLSMLNHLRFYLPEIFPNLKKVLFLDDDNFDPRACGWAYGMNVFDLVEWKKQNITEVYHNWQKLIFTSQRKWMQPSQTIVKNRAAALNVKDIRPQMHSSTSTHASCHGKQCINEDVEKDDINDEIQEDDINDKIQEDDLNDKIQEDGVDDEFQENDIDLDDEFQEEDIDGEFQEDDVDEEFMEDDISNEFQEDDLDALLLEDKLE
ncbi:unnamed protein product [Vicia faba]|uniref:Hexosyltransferase n=1 Tax=Vicia faba TaxID=3906 RepID=A0AAV1BAK4_VICFA|nr:unnamed protein product [Vicia faba]